LQRVIHHNEILGDNILLLGIFATWQTHESNSVWNTFAPSRDIGYLRFAHLNNYERPRPRPDFTTSPHGQRRHLL
jgi:hypothetical protein